MQNEQCHVSIHTFTKTIILKVNINTSGNFLRFFFYEI